MAYTFSNKATEHNRNRYQPKAQLSYFHQLCTFRDPKTKKFINRTILLDESYNIIDMRVNYLTDVQSRALLSRVSDTELKMYATNNLDNISLPNCDDLIKSQSELLQ
jgi:hypothetical protein